jgi:cyclophilin family peptidyl-prolyl cis-trans isomerase
MKYKTISIIAVAIIFVVGYYIFSSKSPEQDKYAFESSTTSSTEASNSSSVESGTSIKTITQKAEVILKTEAKKNNMVKIETNYGDIVIEMYNADAPKTVNNFVTLAQKGFYNNLTFHRIIKGFMIQGGDPNGNGTGGPGYQFEDELNSNTESYKTGYKKGVVAMANAGPNTNGSQFFIMHEDYPLPHAYTIFGHVVSGLDVVDKIANVQTGANDKPVSPVVMKSVTTN